MKFHTKLNDLRRLSASRCTACEDDASRRWIQAGIMREVISIVEGGELTDVCQAVDCWTEGEVVARIDEDTTTTYGGYLCPAE